MLKRKIFSHNRTSRKDTYITDIKSFERTYYRKI